MLKHLLSVICFFFLSTSLNAQWTLDSLPIARSGHSIATANGKIIIIGGNSAGIPADTLRTRVDIYDIASKTWSIEKLSIIREYVFAVGVGKKIYFAGYTSVSAQNQNKIEVYDTENESWSMLTFPDLVSASDMCSYGDKIFFNRNRFVDIFDTKLESWESTSLISNKMFSKGIGCNGKVLFIGGGTPGGGLKNTVDIYDINNGTWSVDTLQEAKSQVYPACISNKVFVVGGTIGFSKYSSLIEIYDTESGTWLEHSSMTSKKTGFGLAATDETIYIAGGYDEGSSGSLSEVEIINGTTGDVTIINMPTSRRVVSAIGVDRKVYITGGFQTDIGKHVNTIDIYSEEETVSVHETTTHHFKIYPNPCRDEIYLIDNQHSVTGSPIVYQIFNQLGGLVLSGIYDGKIDTEILSTGIYFLRYSGESIGCGKFIKH